MQLCDHTNSQFYLFKCRETGDGVAIIELPRMKGIPEDDSPIAFTTISDCHIYGESSITVEWEGCIGSMLVECKFKWEPKDVDEQPSDAMQHFVREHPDKSFFAPRIPEAEALTLLTIGQLDWFRCQNLQYHKRDETRVSMSCDYHGKLDPETA